MTKENDNSENDVVDKLVEISNKIAELERARSEHLKATHGRFNLFTTLLQSHDEVRLHGRYLTHLLNPNAKHDCGHLFLNLFLKKVGLEDLQDQKCSVRAEKFAGKILGLQSYIDIYIEFEDTAVVIENKIWAGDQKKQLERYSIFAERRRKNKVHIFYLTLDGHEPSDFSLGGLDKEKVQCISYGTEILNWLEQCLEKSYACVNINQSLLQYRTVINGLLGNTLEKKDMSEIKELIKQKPEIVKNFSKIKSAIQSLENECINSFYNELQQKLSMQGLAKNSVDIKHPATEKKSTKIRLNEDVSVSYNPKGKDFAVKAFRSYKENKPGIKSKLEALAGEHSHYYHYDSVGLVCWILRGDDKFQHEEFLSRMLDPQKREEKVDECVRQILKFIEVAKDAAAEMV